MVNSEVAVIAFDSFKWRRYLGGIILWWSGVCSRHIKADSYADVFTRSVDVQGTMRNIILRSTSPTAVFSGQVKRIKIQSAPQAAAEAIREAITVGALKP